MEMIHLEQQLVESNIKDELIIKIRKLEIVSLSTFSRLHSVQY